MNHKVVFNASRRKFSKVYSEQGPRTAQNIANLRKLKGLKQEAFFNSIFITFEPNELHDKSLSVKIKMF